MTQGTCVHYDERYVRLFWAVARLIALAQAVTRLSCAVLSEGFRLRNRLRIVCYD